MGPLAHGAEGEVGLEAQGGGAVGFQQGVADEEAVAAVAVHHFLLKHHAAYAVDPRGHLVPLEAGDVFVATGAEVVAFVLVEPQVELCAMLYYRFVQRGEQHMIFLVEFGNGHYHEAVVFPYVAPHECGGAVGPGLVGEKQLLEEAFLQVGHLRLVEFQVAHGYWMGL